MIVVLLGYMGAGKTTIGKDVAKNLNYDFIDLDDYISDNERLSITDIFKLKGEIYFRKIEAQYLKQILKSKQNVVLSLGGGTPCYSGNMDVLNHTKNVRSFYLMLSLNVLVDRLMKEQIKRPLVAHLNSKEEFMEFVGKHLFERTIYYNKANYTVECNNKSRAEITERIIEQLI